jgi:phosphatidylserine synthase
MNVKLKKYLWGLFAFSPWILFFVFVPFILPLSVGMRTAEVAPTPNSIDMGYIIFGNLYMVIVVLCFIFYLNKLNILTKEKKRLWRGLMVIGHAFTIPIFWYHYIWKN